MKSRARANGGHNYCHDDDECSVRAALKRQLYLQLDELDEEI